MLMERNEFTLVYQYFLVEIDLSYDVSLQVDGNVSEEIAKKPGSWPRFNSNAPKVCKTAPNGTSMVILLWQ